MLEEGVTGCLPCGPAFRLAKDRLMQIVKSSNVLEPFSLQSLPQMTFLGQLIVVEMGRFSA
jgi:hypothetical protein